MLCASVVNAINSLKVTLVRVLTRKKAKSKVYKPADFLVWKAPRKKKSSKQLLQIVEALNAFFGGKDLRNQRKE